MDVYAKFYRTLASLVLIFITSLAYAQPQKPRVTEPAPQPRPIEAKKDEAPVKKNSTVIKDVLVNGNLNVVDLMFPERTRPVLGTVHDDRVYYSIRLDGETERKLGCIGKGLYAYSLKDPAFVNKRGANPEIINFAENLPCITTLFTWENHLYVKTRTTKGNIVDQLYRVEKNADRPVLAAVIPEALNPEGVSAQPGTSHHLSLRARMDLIGMKNPDVVKNLPKDLRLRDLSYRTFVSTIQSDNRVYMLSLVSIATETYAFVDSFPIAPKVPSKSEIAAVVLPIKDLKLITDVVFASNGKRILFITDGNQETLGNVVSFQPEKKDAIEFSFDMAPDSANLAKAQLKVTEFSCRRPRFLNLSNEGIVGAEASTIFTWDTPSLWFLEYSSNTVYRISDVDFGRRIGGVSPYKGGYVVTESDDPSIKWFGVDSPFEKPFEAEKVKRRKN